MSTHAPSDEAVELFGFPVLADTMEGAVRRALALMASPERSFIHVVLNAAKISRAARDYDFRALLEQFDLIHADGASVVLASRLLRKPLPERIAGIDLMERLVVAMGEEGKSAFFLGAEEAVLERAVGSLVQKAPGLRVAGLRNGYWTVAEEDPVVRQVAASGADALFVGIPTPAKEAFLVRHRLDLGVGFAMGVGGAFDVFAGKVRRAPLAWQRTGLEWAYRLLQEPRRLWRRYLYTNTHFLWLLVREIIGFSAFRTRA